MNIQFNLIVEIQQALVKLQQFYLRKVLYCKFDNKNKLQISLVNFNTAVLSQDFYLLRSTAFTNEITQVGGGVYGTFNFSGTEGKGDVIFGQICKTSLMNFPFDS